MLVVSTSSAVEPVAAPRGTWYLGSISATRQSPAGTGSANVNVLPLPTSLSTQMRPPWSATIWRDGSMPTGPLRLGFRPRRRLSKRLEDRTLSGRCDADPRVGDRHAGFSSDEACRHVDPPPRGGT